MEHEELGGIRLRSDLDEAIEAVKTLQKRVLSYGYGAAALADSYNPIRLANEFAYLTPMYLNAELSKTLETFNNDFIRQSAEAARNLSAGSAAAAGAALAKIGSGSTWGSSDRLVM